MNILILGAGMYVTGRSGYGNATILSSIAEISKEINIGRLVIVGKSPKNDYVAEAVSKINSRLGTAIAAEYLSLSGTPETFLKNLHEKIKFDIGIVCLPDNLHYEYTKYLLNLKIHTQVVKPFVNKLQHAKELSELQEKNNVWGCVEFHKRFDEANLYAKKIFMQHQIGDILYITVDYSQKIVIPTEIFRSWCEKTNIFQYLGVHYVDLIYFITGYLPLKLTAYGSRGILNKMGIDAMDSINASIMWYNPANPAMTFISQFNTNWIDPNSSSAMSDQKYKIVGTAGRIELDQKNRGVSIVNEEEKIRDINPYFSEYLYDIDGKLKFTGYGYRSLRQFICDVNSLELNQTTLPHLAAHRPGFKSSLVSVAVIETVNQALIQPYSWIDVIL